eukprot:TRINITY_DN7220_c0_g1_i1.p1 TRINITY_DN7220_c0_g1~~TRINITY_DN7220_c0_g1_i1.p1  ORF type:complete len:366 (+),score=59.54 TRINITY_DN7220_c0_g1_i1:513-1610(+)
MVTSEHEPLHGQKHDVNVEIRGPSATDVSHSFIQRWNEACDYTNPYGAYPSLNEAGMLPFPERCASPIGRDRVQIQRTIRKHAYRDGTPAPNQTRHFDIWNGEASILAQYEIAIKSAKRSIYIENQHIAHPHLLQLIIEALDRGVMVTYMVPGFRFEQYLNPTLATIAAHTIGKSFGSMVRYLDGWFRWMSPPPRHQTLCGESPISSESQYANVFLEILPKMASHPRCFLGGLIVPDSHYQSLYIHSKIMIVDDEWFTCGSANLVDLSLERDHTELNASVWSRDAAKSLRVRLYSEHLAADTQGMDDLEAMKLFHSRADANQKLMLEGKQLDCMAHRMDGDVYGTVLFILSLVLERRSLPRSALK